MSTELTILTHRPVCCSCGNIAEHSIAQLLRRAPGPNAAEVRGVWVSSEVRVFGSTRRSATLVLIGSYIRETLREMGAGTQGVYSLVMVGQAFSFVYGGIQRR